MSKNKRYYWLKLKEDFFEQRQIKKLRRISGGDTFTIIYLKMQLLALNTGGLISFEQTEANIEEQLSLELGESLDDVKMTLAFLQMNDMVELCDSGDVVISDLPVGSEGATAAIMRRRRAALKQAEDCALLPKIEVISGDITDNMQGKAHKVKQSERGVRKCETDIDIDIEIERDIEIENRTIYPPEFERFWLAYPKKKGKGGAYKRWKQIKPNKALVERMISSVTKSKTTKDWIKDNGDYIPYPAKWLNEERWEDDIDEGRIGDLDELF